MPSLSFTACLRRPPPDRTCAVGNLPLAGFEPPEEAAFVAFVADAGAMRFHLDQHRVEVAIGGDLLDHQAMAGAFAFEPELLPGAAVEGSEARLDGQAEGLFVHVADHEDAPGGVILDDGGDEAVRLFEIQIHGEKAIKKARRFAAGVLSESIEEKLGHGPSQEGMVMMMMPRDECHCQVFANLCKRLSA